MQTFKHTSQHLKLKIVLQNFQVQLITTSEFKAKLFMAILYDFCIILSS